MEQRSPRRANCSLTHDTAQQLAVDDEHLAIARCEVWLILLVLGSDRCITLHGQSLGQQHGEDLLARPKHFRLDDRRDRKLAVPNRQPHEDVHDQVLLHVSVALRVLRARQQAILHDAHHGFVALRRHHLSRVQHHVFDLRPRLVRLSEMKIHLISVEVRVVRRRDCKIESQCRKRHYLGPVTHHAHLVQRWLAIEDDIISI
mmetsp:Transcript_63111/g.150780  ORF Transcript_63111/g.150780 Transcript_63111/m.150780 type:complete len:202 (-) Transcript_63111:1262-1867(-)